MKYNRGSVLWVCLALLILLLPQGVSATTYYTYDTLGRVKQVVESDGTTTQYDYDANGNITSVNRIAGTSVLSIGSVSASRGASGSSVIITGSGFSSIPSQDVVTFNGVAATVTYASGNRVVVTVPPGATTGDISITTPSSTITSNSSFTVVPVSVTSLSPTSGVAGTVLTVNGGGFDPTPANNTVSINGIPATVISATTTQLQVTVPSGATPGHVSVTSPLGSATGTGYFFIPAAGYTPSQIAEVVVESPGVAEILPVNGANQVGVILFDGVAGQRFSMAITNVGGAEPSYTLYAPDGSRVASDLNPANQEVQLAPLTQTGTYAWYYRPGSIPSSATYQLQADVVGQLPTDGTPTPTSLAAGQNATYTFAGTAGQSYNLTLTPFSPTGYVDATVFNPDGSKLIDCGAYQAYYNETQNCPFTISTTATYTLRIVPESNALAPASFNTYVVQDFSATLTAGTPGPAVPLTLIPEQNGDLSFTATANQTLALYIAPPSKPLNDLFILRISGPGPIANNLVNLGNGTTTATFNLPNLGAGNYLVTIRPYTNGGSLSTTATLANGVTGTLTTDGTPTPVQTYVPGQYAYFTFNGTQGQSLSLALSQLSLTPTSVNSASVTVTNPDGSAYKSATCYPSSTPGCSLNLGTLAQTGTYSVTINPDGQATMGFAVSIPPNVTGSLSLNNSTTVALNSVGQQANLTFVATANEAVILSVGSITTTPANTAVTFYIYNASGTLVTQASQSTDGTWNIGTLAAGTYTVVVAPNNAATASMSLDMQPAQTTAVPTNGTPTSIATAAPGENAYATFQASAGDSISITLTNLALSSGSSNSVSWTMTAPDKSVVSNAQTCQIGAITGCTTEMMIVPQTGTYTINVVSPASQTLSLTVSVAENVNQTLSPGATQTINMSPQAGEAARFTFTVASGQHLTASLSSLSYSPSSVEIWMGVYRTDGSNVNGNATTSGEVLNLSGLSPGTYYLWIGSLGIVNGSMQLSFQ